MWVCSTYGFFSVVRAEGRPAQVMVRARARPHLVALLHAWSRLSDGAVAPVIVESRDTDYRFRLFVDHAVWVAVVAAMAADINYTNFKGDVHEHPRLSPAEARAYSRALHDVWAVFRRLQDWRPGGRVGC